MVSKESILRFKFIPDNDRERRLNGYGSGSLHIDGRPFWFSNTEADPKPLVWTWVDFLEHIGSIWPALVAEQVYPFDWLNKHAVHPGEIWKHAEFRWARLGDAVADVEEPVLYEFHTRHNLAAGWKGIALPALFWLRVGNSVWLSPEEGTPFRSTYMECIDSIQSIGDQLAEAFDGTDNPRVEAAIRVWRARQATLHASFVELTTGLTKTELFAIEGGRSRDAYWEIQDTTNCENVSANESEFLAAARMSKGFLQPPAIAKIIETIRNTSKTETHELDALSHEAIFHLKSVMCGYAHESGYKLAEWVRNKLKVGMGESFDIQSVLSSFGVEIMNMGFGSDHVEAIAFWGTRGPSIIFNVDRSYAQNKSRMRMTLAHEFCHLLVDRERALPVADVLGGSVDLYVERRANAFAAEILMPRSSVELAVSQDKQQLIPLLQTLCQKFVVSKTVACAQIYNSPIFSSLERREQGYIENRIRPIEQFGLSEEIISTIV